MTDPMSLQVELHKLQDVAEDVEATIVVANKTFNGRPSKLRLLLLELMIENRDLKPVTIRRSRPLVLFPCENDNE